MGERCDDLSHAFDGEFMDWDCVLGSGFERAPKDWVSVFRECSIEELVRIARDGLVVPAPELRPAEIRQEMEILDRYRPAHLARQGVSRLRATYAVPAADDAPRLPFRQERIILEMKVDPAESYVGDMDFITCLIPFIGVHRYGLDRFQGAFRKYWDSVMPLSHFLHRYVRLEAGPVCQWVPKGRVTGRMPRNFFSPEIMVMTPVIGQRHIRIVRREPAEEDDAIME